MSRSMSRIYHALDFQGLTGKFALRLGGFQRGLLNNAGNVESLRA